ncbi:hypothetical protein O6H91_Y576400 [Diphasiastrum complanatum]|nr:hypothetical protein O6H91_Y576400 [Diphasiastrum complanatum]
MCSSTVQLTACTKTWKIQMIYVELIIAQVDKATSSPQYARLPGIKKSVLVTSLYWYCCVPWNTIVPFGILFPCSSSIKNSLVFQIYIQHEKKKANCASASHCLE